MAYADGAPKLPYADVVSGTEGTAPLDIVIKNLTDGPLSCSAALAHWFSEDLGTIPTGHTLTFRLWHEAGTGVLNRLNDANERMPVETIFCTVGGETVRLPLTIRSGALPTQQRLTCRNAVDQVTCTAD
ncbi:MAG: hypothetical protein AAGB11_04165 [Pseudomonadota bacterium]